MPLTYFMRVRSFLPCVLLVALTLWLAPAAASDGLQQRLDAWQAGFVPQAGAVRLRHPDLLQGFYQEHHFQPLWLDRGALNDQAKLLLATVATVGNEGLLAEDYHGDTLAELADNPASLTAVDVELLLSDSFLTLIGHLLAGKTDPNLVAGQGRSAARARQLDKFLPRLASGETLAQMFQEARPNQPRYYRLIRALADLRALSAQPWPAFDVRPSIKTGSRDLRLPDVAQRLMLLGDLSTDWQADHFDPVISQAVRNFQLRHGLKPDGDIGPETFSALNITPAQRAAQVLVNLERWRWLDSDLGERFILVNIAGYDLRVIENNERIMHQPVIVGRDYRQTPVFSDKIRYLVFNPTWTVPFKLAIHDKLPEIKRNPNYLAEYGFTLYEGGTSTVVDPASVDWQRVSRKNFNFRLVQSPGPLNALGQVKFMFPNAYDVYLHDTPTRELFGQHRRAFSSGCIRVANPLVLAELLLAEEGWTRAQLDALIASGVTKTVHLKKPVPVHIEYWTAWVNSTGTLHFRNDIYQRDLPLYNALNQPLAPPSEESISPDALGASLL